MDCGACTVPHPRRLHAADGGRCGVHLCGCERFEPAVGTLRKVWSVAKNPWALLALSVLGALLLAWRLNAGRGADAAELAQLRREKDEATVEAAKLRGVLVAHQVEVAVMRARADGLSADVRAALARIEKLTGKLRVLSVVRAGTTETAAGGAPRGAGGAGGPGVPAEARPDAPQPAPACLLAVGDLGTVQVEEVAAETRGGARVVLGEAWAWRTRPGRARLFGGPWATELSEAAVAPPAVAPGGPGWGGGAWASVGRGGAVAGPALALPPLLGLEATVGGGLGADGAWAAGASVVWRPR
jgi:hypothetical protein